MPLTTVQPAEVTRPTTTPLKSSILDHAVVKDNVSDFGLRPDDGLWLSYNCIDTFMPTQMCPDPLDTPKVPVFAGWQPAFTFPVYGAVQCHTVGLDVADMKSEMKRVYLLNEGKGIEEALLLNRFVASEPNAKAMGGQPVEWDAPTDLTPAQAPSLVVALALLESHAAHVYAGVPTIHMPRGAATVLENQGLIEWTGNKAFTKSGSKVAMGGGYDEPEMIASGLWDLYATGEVYIEKGEQIDVGTWTGGWDLPTPDQGENYIVPPNSSTAMVERMYRVAVDCFVAKATGKVF